MTRQSESDKSRRAVGIVLRALRGRDTNLRAWALAQGYQPGTARAVVRRWAWRPQQRPHGGIGRELMERLHADFPEVAGEIRDELHGNTAQIASDLPSD